MGHTRIQHNMRANRSGAIRLHFSGRTCGAWAVLAAASLLLPLSAVAQFSRSADEIEIKRLDFHPKGSFLRAVGVEIYGVLDQALIWHRPVIDTGLFQAASPQWELGALSASYVGIRGTEVLDLGWRAHFKLEHGFNADLGSPANDRAKFWDRGSSVGVSHLLWGRVDLGRIDQPAWQVALMADPWGGGGSVATPGDDNFYVKPPGTGGVFRNRTDKAIAYTSPEALRDLSVQLQGSAKDEAGAVQEYGMAWRYQSGALVAAFGWQRWRGDTQAWPLAAVYTFAQWRGYAGATFGRVDGVDYRNLFVGAAIPERSGPHPGEFRLGLNHHQTEGQAARWKLSAGRVHPLSKRTLLQAEAGVEAQSGTATKSSLGFGIRHAFAL